MPQWKLDVTGMASRDDAKKIIARGEEVAGVHMVNANHETGIVVVTYADERFDQAAFSAAVTELGFNS